MRNKSPEIKAKATQEEIYNKLYLLLGQNAIETTKQCETLIIQGKREDAFSILKEYDATLGGVGVYQMQFGKKLPGIYRAFSYVGHPLLMPGIKNNTRLMVHASCVYVEELLKKVVRTWFWQKGNDNYSPLGRLLNQNNKYIPVDLKTNLIWLNDYVYNFAKHHFNMENDVEEPEHYFSVGEAVAVYLIVRKLGLTLEKLSGKSEADLMKEN